MTAPYAFIDARGHEVMVLDETFTVLADIGGEQVVITATDDFEFALTHADSLKRDGIPADIEHERSTLDLTAAVDDHIAEYGSPLDYLAVDWRNGGTG